MARKKEKIKEPVLRVYSIIKALLECDTSGQFCSYLRSNKSNKLRLELLIPNKYFESSAQRRFYLERLNENNNLSCLLTANLERSGFNAYLHDIAEDLLTSCGYKKFLRPAHDQFLCEYKKSEQLCNGIPEEIRRLPTEKCESIVETG